MKKLLITLSIFLGLGLSSVHAATIIEVPIENKITGLYVAFFNRAADEKGMNYWAGQAKKAQDEGKDVIDVMMTLASKFAIVPTFRIKYQDMNNRQFVEAIYQNALGKAGNVSGINYWEGRLNAGMSRSDMVATFINTSLTKPATKENYPTLSDEDLQAAQNRQAFIQNKITVALVFTHQMQELSNVADPFDYYDEPAYLASIKIISEVTEDPQTVLITIGFLNEVKDKYDPINEIIFVKDMTDKEAPVLTIVGDNPLEITQGETFTDPGAIAQDSRDGSITVLPSGKVDMGVEGTYTIKYVATDAAGNKADAERTVIVLFNGTVRSVSSLLELRKALRDASLNNVNDVIELSAGTYDINEDGRGAFAVEDQEAFNLTLRAAPGLTSEDVILDGHQVGRVLTYNNTSVGTLKIERISVVNGKSANGAGVYAAHNVVVQDCNISQNDGIGIYAKGTVQIDNSNISDNTNTGFAALGTGSTTVTDSTISKNLNGGFLSYGAVSVSASQIIDNYSSLYYVNNKGGGFYAAGDVKVTDSNVSGNYLYGSKSEGGGFYAKGNVVVENSIFSENTVKARNFDARGAGFFASKYADVKECTFTSNSAYSSYDNTSGAGFLAGGALVERSTFTSNTVKVGGNSVASGGGFYVYYPSHVINSKFLNNSAATSGGAFFVYPNASRGGANVINSMFISNSARYGSAMYAKSNPHNVINSQFIGNINAPAIKSYGVFINNVFDKNEWAIETTNNTTIYNSYIDETKIITASGITVTRKNILDPYYEGELFLNDDSITLQSASPVIDKGLNPGSATFQTLIGNIDTYTEIVERLTVDILGNQRIYNNTIDMGVAEYGASK